MNIPVKQYVFVWLFLNLVLLAVLAYGLSFDKLTDAPLRADARALFLPGQTTSGHHQIELACDACHSEAGGGREMLQTACMNCHGAELKEARDSHPKSKFTDPRNAERAARLDAAWCVTCHVEHKPHMTGDMAVTLPTDFCHTCHDDIAKERPSHQGMAFDTCASAGCHNFHDNRALYEDFLLKHARADAPPPMQVPARDFSQLLHAEEFYEYPYDLYPVQVLQRQQADAHSEDMRIEDDWLASSHAQAGVNCSACHQPKPDMAWTDKPGQGNCNACHAAEIKGFGAGKHGMRITQQLTPMTPAQARLPMNEAAHDSELACTSCHAAHHFDTRKAAVEACLGCHNDTHSLAYKQSPHYELWQKELRGDAEQNSGVSCASCHLPRVEFRTPDDVKRMLVQHNQNDTLRPNEKMIRPVCLNCHSLQDSIDALADEQLISRNFNGHPATHIKGSEMALAREAAANQSRPEASADDE